MSSTVSTEQLRAEFAKYDLMLLKEFADLLLPLPRSQKHKVFKIKTSDDFDFYVWGESTEDILASLHRFLQLRVFI